MGVFHSHGDKHHINKENIRIRWKLWYMPEKFRKPSGFGTFLFSLNDNRTSVIIKSLKIESIGSELWKNLFQNTTAGISLYEVV